MHMQRPLTDVVIPVHNSPDDVRRCLSSCVRSLSPGDRAIVVDDGSAPETEEVCRQIAKRNMQTVTLIRRREGSGFCRAANAGIRESTAPVIVLLNSDTVVPLGWLDRIGACFAANADIGIVGPLSNAGGWQSIPGLGAGGPPNNRIINDDATLAKIHEYCAGFSRIFDYPVIEQMNGFCLAIRRAVFDCIGLLDEDHFPMGYGEEVDFNFRAQNAGFLSAVAIDCFVYHEKTKSYTSERRKRLVAEGRAHNDRIHGIHRVKDAVAGSRENPILKAIRAQSLATFAARGWLIAAGCDERVDISARPIEN